MDEHRSARPYQPDCRRQKRQGGPPSCRDSYHVRRTPEARGVLLPRAQCGGMAGSAASKAPRSPLDVPPDIDLGVGLARTTQEADCRGPSRKLSSAPTVRGYGELPAICVRICPRCTGKLGPGAGNMRSVERNDALCKLARSNILVTVATRRYREVVRLDQHHTTCPESWSMAYAGPKVPRSEYPTPIRKRRSHQRGETSGRLAAPARRAHCTRMKNEGQTHVVYSGAQRRHPRPMQRAASPRGALTTHRSVG